MKKYIDISIIEDYVRQELDKVRGGVEPFAAGKEMAYEVVLEFIGKQETNGIRKVLKKWSESPEGKEKYKQVRAEMLEELGPNLVPTCTQLSPSQGLDEAAEEYKKNHPMKAYWLEDEYIEEHTTIDEAFKAGAEWMAGQGQTKEGIATKDYFVNFGDDTSVDLDPSMTLNPAFNINDGDKVIVQIRKI